MSVTYVTVATIWGLRVSAPRRGLFCRVGVGHSPRRQVLVSVPEENESHLGE